LIGDFGQGLSGDPFPLPIRVEEPKHSLGLLKGLNQSVQQQSIEAPIVEFDAILVVLVKGVHGGSPVW
jgi:hypothetical protein